MSELSASGTGSATGFDGLDRVIGGVLHYASRHDGIGHVVHSYYVPESRLLIDPMAPPGLIEMLMPGGVDRVVLTNRHHYRAAGKIAGVFACTVHAPVSGMHEFDDGREVVGYEWGEELAPGIVAHEFGAICPDDGAIHIATGPGALAFADGIVVWDGRLAFVPDSLMDDPGQVKRKTLTRLEELSELDFDALLLAHGDPIPSGAKQAIAAFLDDPHQADFA